MHSAAETWIPHSEARFERLGPTPRKPAFPEGRDDVSKPQRPSRTQPVTQRVASLDALRGFSMIWLLGADVMAVSLRPMTANLAAPFAALGDAIAYQLEHAAWEGLRFYDLIFPLFIFVTGVSIVFSLPRLVEQKGVAAAHRRVFTRALLLFALGVICYGGLSNPWPEIRILGVLQRIALAYLFAALLFLHLRPKGLALAFAGILVGYWALLTFVPVPGVGAASYEKELNLAHWLDAQLLPGKLWHDTWDPEGILSTLPAVATCLAGVFAGLLLKDSRLPKPQISVVLLAAGALAAAAGLLWSLQFPIIKPLWTSSFVLVCAGLSAIMLGVLHQIMDVWGMVRWAKVLLWIGASAIVLYVFNSIVSFERLAVRLVGGDIGSWLDRAVAEGSGRFAAHAMGLMLAILLARFLYRRRIFLRV